MLERERVQIGIVTGIRGNASFEVTFRGAARHAGTTPMHLRCDAGLGAAELISGVRETVMRDFPNCVANVGAVELKPGAFNVIPELAKLKLECRSVDGDELDALADRLLALAHDIAERNGLGVEIERVGRWAPAQTHAPARRAIAEAARSLGLTAMEMPSGAGHDAQVLARVTTTGMVFVPSVQGISHDAEELTELADCVNGANVLLGATVRLAQSL